MDTSKSSNVIIQPAEPHDAAGIYEVQRQGWIATYPNPRMGITKEDVIRRIEGTGGSLKSSKIERWQKTIADHPGRLIVARKEKKVVGYVAIFYDDLAKQVRLGSLYVTPELQGQGLGTLLLQQAIVNAGRVEDIYLHVVTYNEGAIKFYEKHGFVKTGKKIESNVAALPSGIHLPEIEMVLPKLK